MVADAFLIFFRCTSMFNGQWRRYTLCLWLPPKQVFPRFIEWLWTALIFGFWLLEGCLLAVLCIDTSAYNALGRLFTNHLRFSFYQTLTSNLGRRPVYWGKTCVGSKNGTVIFTAELYSVKRWNKNSVQPVFTFHANKVFKKTTR